MSYLQIISLTAPSRQTPIKCASHLQANWVVHLPPQLLQDEGLSGSPCRYSTYTLSMLRRVDWQSPFSKREKCRLGMTLQSNYGCSLLRLSHDLFGSLTTLLNGWRHESVHVVIEIFQIFVTLIWYLSRKVIGKRFLVGPQRSSWRLCSRPQIPYIPKPFQKHCQNSRFDVWEKVIKPYDRWLFTQNFQEMCKNRF